MSPSVSSRRVDDLSIFVPCLNEGPRIEGTIDAICEGCAGIDFEIVVANDGSTDDTVERLRAAQHAHPDVKITLLDSRINRGLGYFYLAAAYVGTGEHFIFIPGDNVVPVNTIRQIMSYRGQADIIIPYLGDLDPRPPRRQKLSNLFVSIVNLLGGQSIKYYNGFVLHRRANICAAPTLARGPAYQAELINHLVGAGASYLEIKVSVDDLVKSDTWKLRNVWPVGIALFRIVTRRIRRMVAG